MVEFIKPEFEFSDDRGSLYQLYSKGWNQVNVSYTKGGVIRGGHYHKKNKEVFFVVSGECKIELEDVNNGEKKDFTVKDGDMFVLYPFAKHTFNYVKDTIMVAAYDIGFILDDGTKDVFE